MKKSLQAIMLSLAILFGSISLPTTAKADYYCEWMPSFKMQCSWDLWMIFGTYCYPTMVWEYYCVPCYGAQGCGPFYDA